MKLKRYEITFKNEYYAESSEDAFDKQMNDIDDQAYDRDNWRVVEKEDAPICDECNKNQMDSFYEDCCEKCLKDKNSQMEEL